MNRKTEKDLGIMILRFSIVCLVLLIICFPYKETKAVEVGDTIVWENEDGNRSVFIIEENHTVSLKQYTMNQDVSGIVEIPEHIIYGDSGSEIIYTVVGISTDAFGYGNTNYESVILPDTITYIGERAFYGCTNLKTVKMSLNITSIGESAFSKCSSLSNIDLPDSITSIGRAAFLECKSLSYVHIPNSLQVIEESTFNKCYGLKGDIVIPKSVKVIGEYAFYNDYLITGVCFENETILEVIGPNAFDGCLSLTGILELPEGLTTLWHDCFRNNHFREIYIPSTVTLIDQAVFNTDIPAEIIINNSSEILDYSSISNNELYTYVDENGNIISRINNSSGRCYRVFQMPENCVEYEGILYSKNSNGEARVLGLTHNHTGSNIEIKGVVDSEYIVTEIDAYAFNDCNISGNVIIPGTIKKIGENAFENCRLLSGTLNLGELSELVHRIIINQHKIPHLI